MSSRTLFVAKLASLLVEAVRHVLLPDVGFRRMPFVKRLVVPLIVIRNHDKWDPLEPGADTSIDVEAVKEQVDGGRGHA